MSEPGNTPEDREADAAPQSLDEDNRLTDEFVRSVSDAVDQADPNLAQELVNPLHNADIADLFELVDEDERAPLAAALGDLVSADVLAEMNEHVREDLIEILEPGQIADLTEQLETDDAVAIIEDLKEGEQKAVLAELDAEDRAVIETALTYPEETAGRIMQRDLVAVPEHMNVGQLIDYLREHDDLTTEFWEIFVVDPAHKPVGTCQLSWILRTPRDIAVSDVMKREQTLVPADMDQEEVALRFQKYNLISAAVVDEDGRLIGMITVDDILHIVEDEASEDVLLLSGAGEGDINEPIRESYRARVRWLIANLATALLASFVISIFGAAIEQMVALAILMPIVASIGGNAGTQTMAVSVRALAMNELTRSNTRRIIGREFRIALLNGGTVAVLVGIGTALIFANPMLGGVIAAAMLVNIVIAGFAGIFVPVMLDRLHQDPALASSVFVTMITDTMGFLAFLGFAVASGLVGL
ncbi:magnesium transporter [Parasphingorhabdus marina DSM 22363]|uniref:Magnesium transporter MgtE n=1 Tax=Parasphingorhabdus marina DSM 22363 TaxID=1123272 RepID=A0A1N6HCQ1_9SPHN|nr:magnesium transporter [Parasphingorhabdus marina]SIO17546.1 magnesium transporter [Parasphingorhabdus marina DSM 22363]